MKRLPIFAAGLVLAASTLFLQAKTPVEGPKVPAEAVSGSWTALNRQALPQHVSDAKPWEEGVPNQDGEARLLFRKVSGSGFAVRTGLYCGGGVYKGPLQQELMSGKVQPDDLGKLDQKDFTGLGVYEIKVEEAQPGVKNLVLTLRMIGLPQNEHFSPFQLIERLFPAALYLNGSKEPVYATGRLKVSKGLSDGFPEEVFSVQWDLSEVKEEIRSFRVEWTQYAHSSITGVRLDQSTQFAPIVADRAPQG